jgi:hypothetical protein
MLYFDMLEQIQVLTNAERGKLLTAILEYGKEGKKPDFRGKLALAWGFVQPKIDWDGERYDSVIAKRKYAGYCSHLTRNHMEPISYEAWLEREEEKNGKDTKRLQQHTAYADTCQPTASTITTTKTNIITNSSLSSSSDPWDAADASRDGSASEERKQVKLLYGKLNRGDAAMTEQQLDGILDKIGTAKFEEYLVKLNRSGILQGKALQKDYTQMIRWYTEDMAS